ncbi:MAG: hypothetical protein WDM86_01305 [Rhizomicrobium sp.]
MTMTTYDALPRSGFLASRGATVLLATLISAMAGAGGAALVSTGMLSNVGHPAPVAAPAAEPDAAPRPPLPPHPALPRMQLQAQYAGPLQDTVVQRLRDPVDGTICYVYLPIAVHHAAVKQENEYVDYGANAIGALSCYASPVSPRAAAAHAAPVPSHQVSPHL